MKLQGHTAAEWRTWWCGGRLQESKRQLALEGVKEKMVAQDQAHGRGRVKFLFKEELKPESCAQKTQSESKGLASSVARIRGLPEAASTKVPRHTHMPESTLSFFRRSRQKQWWLILKFFGGRKQNSEKYKKNINYSLTVTSNAATVPNEFWFYCF